ncbi:hypothetical protein ALP8811_01543 [Aliiroseovarius pelagivivens]|uniref:Sialate O-acetylesterase domain-containing protein n=1 Tax=Aliiroseovarius pelagivivens TaxID=1639690 RepID=A0A2R8AKG3_9RHOB|nr:hypothetical protein [Aliiroseovarius pelagivivens]SPF76535.1 hypothetical protein ALP8811_01543 [Aliiroseovarius pelagivivens]
MTTTQPSIIESAAVNKPDRILAKCRQLTAWAQKLPRCFSSNEQAVKALPEFDESEFILAVVSQDGTQLEYYHRDFDDPNVPALSDGIEGWCQILEVHGSLQHAVGIRQALLLAPPNGNTKPLLEAVPVEQKKCVVISPGCLTVYSRNDASELKPVLLFTGSFISTSVNQLAGYLGTLHSDLGGHVNNQTDRLPSQGKFMALWNANLKRKASRLAKAVIDAQRPQIYHDFPENSKDRQSVNGRKEFLIDAGHGSDQRCYLSPEGFVRPITDRSILLMHTGQSNAGIHPAGGPISGVIKTPYHILTPNDGRGTRGLMGTVPRGPITDIALLDEYVWLPLQSVVGAAASTYLAQIPKDQEWPQIIVRSEAIGGQAFIGNSQFPRRPGLHKNELGERAQCFKNLISTAVQTVKVAKEQGAPVEVIYIAFTHQEADRGARRESYAELATNFFKDVEDGLSHLNIPVFWLLDQSPGTFRDSSWQARLALKDLADRFPNVHLIQPRYPYPLHDTTHWSNRAKALYGEFLGRAIWDLEQGNRCAAISPIHAARSENEIRIRFDNETSLVLDETYFPAPPANFGFQIIGPRQRASIQQVRVISDCEISIQLDRVPRDDMGAALGIRYAMADLPEDKRVTGWAAGIGCLREERGFPSLAFEGVTHHPWVPAFEIKGL